MIIHDLYESPQLCPECGGISFSDLILAEKKDACYYKVKASAKVWPSAYASGRLVQCRKKGADSYGNKSEGVAEGSQEDAKFTPRLQIRSQIETALDQYLDPEKVAGAYTDIQYYKHDGKVYVEVLFNYTDGQKIGPKQRKQFLVNKDFTLTPIKKQGVAEGSEWETRHDEFTTVGDRATPEQINKIVSALGVAAKQASSKRGFLNKIVGKQSNGDLARMAQGAETLAKNIQRNSNAKPGTDERKELGQHLVYAVSLLKRMNGEQGVAEGLSEMDKSQTPPGRDGSNDPDAGKKEYTAKAITAKKVAKHAEKILNKELNKKPGVAEGKADYNFDIEDLKRLERIRDLATLKAQALALISKPSAKPMKPEKVEWFKNALERMNSPMKVIKLMYDLLLSGEGNAVVGTRSSMNPNSYRQRFGEQGMAEGNKKSEPPEADYGADYQDMVARVKKLAGLGPMKTVYDPTRRVYRNVPTAVQPPKK